MYRTNSIPNKSSIWTKSVVCVVCVVRLTTTILDVGCCVLGVGCWVLVLCVRYSYYLSSFSLSTKAILPM